MKVEIDDEFADEIVRGALMETYLNLSDSLKNNRNAHEDDIETWSKVVPAIEIVAEWFFYDFKGKVKEAKAKRKKK